MKRLLAVLALIPLAGCTQIAQLQPVAGAEVTAVRIATNDVLVDKGVPIGVAPVCDVEGDLYVCKGTTRNGREIRSEAKSLEEFGDDDRVRCVLAGGGLAEGDGGSEIFNGQVETVLADNAQEAKRVPT